MSGQQVLKNPHRVYMTLEIGYYLKHSFFYFLIFNTAIMHFSHLPAPTLGNHQSVSCIYELGFFVLFLSPTYKRNHTVFLILWLTDLFHLA